MNVLTPCDGVMIDWFSLQNGENRFLHSDKNRILRRKVFPGLWLDLPALLDLNTFEVLQSLQEGLNSKEQAEFATALEESVSSSLTSDQLIPGHRKKLNLVCGSHSVS